MSEDLIKRSDVAEVVYKALKTPPLKGVLTDTMSLAIAMVQDIPSADRRQGEWKRRLVDNGFNADWVCSECGYRVKTDFVSFNYCPNCGCRMKGADDEQSMV